MLKSYLVLTLKFTNHDYDTWSGTSKKIYLIRGSVYAMFRIGMIICADLLWNSPTLNLVRKKEKKDENECKKKFLTIL